MSDIKGNYVKIHRSLLEWEWYTDVNTLTVFLYLMLRANWKPNKVRGIQVGRGQTLETLPKIAKSTGLTLQSVRTAINHLKSTGEITEELTAYGRLINVVNYAKFQDTPDSSDSQINSQVNRQLTGDQQATNRQLTALEEYKNIKKERIEEVKREGREKNSKGRSGSMASAPSLQSIKQFFANNSFRSDPDHFYQHYEGLGWKNIKGREITDWKRTAREWERREKKFTEERMTPQSNMIVPAPDYMREDYSFEEDNTPDDLDLEDSET